MKRKLTPTDVEEMLTLFSQGWKQAHLRRKYNIDHSTVHYYVEKFGVVRSGEPFKMPPQEIRHTYSITIKQSNLSRVKTYADYVREDREREQERQRLEKIGIVDKRYDHPPTDMVKWGSGIKNFIN